MYTSNKKQIIGCVYNCNRYIMGSVLTTNGGFRKVALSFVNARRKKYLIDFTVG